MKLVHTPMATSQIYIRAANGNMSQNGNGNGKRRKGQGQGDDDDVERFGYLWDKL